MVCSKHSSEPCLGRTIIAHLYFLQYHGSMLTAIALLIATAIPVVVLYIIFSRNLYATTTPLFIVLCVAWGVLSFGLAFALNTASMDAGLVTVDQFRRFSAPILEEIIKGIILVVLVRQARFQYFVDGAIYGFAVGIGFAVVENYFYIFENIGFALDVAIARVISTNLMHATASALIGIAFGYSKTRKGLSNLGVVLLGIALGMLLHVGFNNLVTRVSSGLLLTYAATVGIGGALFIYYMIRRGLADARSWIQDHLGEADRVTRREAAVVDRMSDLGEVLQPISELFGPAKTEQVEKFLLKQAQLGIYRNQLNSLSEGRKRTQQLNLIEETQTEMNALRHQVGSYVMVTVRMLLPDEGIPSMYVNLDDRIEKVKQTGTGFNLFDTLSTRVVKPTNTETTETSETEMVNDD